MDFFDRHAGPVDVGDVYRFLRKCRKKYAKLQNSGCDIEQIIGLYVAGATSRFVEEQFVALFRTLEKFMAEYRSKQKYDGFIERERWRKISAELRHFTETRMKRHKKAARERIKDGITGLNRRPVKVVFEEMMKAYRIPWSDLADHKSQLSFIDLRHDVMHRGRVTDISRFATEIIRLRAIVGRLILWRLGWYDYEQAGWEYRRFSDVSE